MKKFLAILAAFCILAAGCTTTQPTNGGGGSTPVIYVDDQGLLVVAGMVVQPSVIGLTIGTVASFELSKLVQDDPNSISYLVSVKSLIDASLANGQFDPVALKAALDKISINEIKNNNLVKQAIVVAIDQYAAYYGATVDQKIQNVTPYLKPILQGISDGIGNVTEPKMVPRGGPLKKLKK